MKRHAFVVALVLFFNLPTQTAPAQTATCNGKTVTTSGNQGTNGDDVMVGTEGDDRIDGAGGNDTICGLGGDDVIDGFMGDDFLDGGAGSDRLYGCHSSHGYSDAIVCFQYSTGATDSDVLVGGEGDDHLSGHLDNDDLDGGEGVDGADGGESTDSCSAEHYARCEQVDPAPAVPECSDGIDNDSDGSIDAAADPECSRERDPTEWPRDDPTCYNGNDDDDDGDRDYPEDLGCSTLQDTDEFNCAFCPPPNVTIRYRRGFRGEVFELQDRCGRDRVLLVKRMRSNRVRTVGRTRVDMDGRWRWDESRSRGRYVAVAPRFTYHTEEDDPICKRLRSETIGIRN